MLSIKIKITYKASGVFIRVANSFYWLHDDGIIIPLRFFYISWIVQKRRR